MGNNAKYVKKIHEKDLSYGYDIRTVQELLGHKGGKQFEAPWIAPGHREDMLQTSKKTRLTGLPRSADKKEEKR